MLKSLRAVAENPITQWATVLLNLCTAIVAVLTLLMNTPIVPPEVVAVLVSVVAVLNTIIGFLRILVPAS